MAKTRMRCGAASRRATFVRWRGRIRASGTPASRCSFCVGKTAGRWGRCGGTVTISSLMRRVSILTVSMRRWRASRRTVTWQLRRSQTDMTDEMDFGKFFEDLRKSASVKAGAIMFGEAQSAFFDVLKQHMSEEEAFNMLAHTTECIIKGFS